MIDSGDARHGTAGGRGAVFAAVLGLSMLAATGLRAATPEAPPVGAAAADAGSAGTARTLVREGMRIEFDVATGAAGQPREGGDALMEGDFAEVTFRITDERSGLPVQGLYPAVWMDVAKPYGAKISDAPMSCKQRVGIYLQGMVGVRPLIDLNSYFVLVLNRDPSITVIDPIVGVSGITKLYAQINLEKPGADWTKTSDEKRMFVSMPLAGKVAVVDLERFETIRSVDAGETPMRVRLQPDQKYLWIGNDSGADAGGGVTVLDAESLVKAAYIPTGRGHHEIAFSADSRFAFVSNRQGGTVSVIDVRALAKVAEVKTGPLPISLAYSALSQMLYVADGERGTVTVLKGPDWSKAAEIQARPGLGPLRFSQDGRWGAVVNTAENVLNVIDPATNRISHTIAVGDKPYHVSFSRNFAYVRSLDTERVAMIELQHLARMTDPPVVTFAAGAVAPGQVKDLPLADVITEAPGEAAVMIASPGDKTVYYYMEGMNAPMGNFRNYGHLPRAVNVADRTLREAAPGVYTAKVRVPAAGTYDVAFLLESPRVLHCFDMAALPNPALASSGPSLSVDYLVENRRVTAKTTTAVRFRLMESRSDSPVTGLSDVRVRSFRAPGRDRTEVAARELGDGVYEAELALKTPGAYYVYVSAPSANVEFADLPYLTLVAVKPVPGAAQ